MLYTFVYDKSHLPAWADVQSQEIKFIVDVGLGTESLLDMSPARRFENKAAQMAVVSPDLKEVPVYKTREQVEAEQKAAVEAAKGPALAPASRAAIDGLPKEPFGPLALLSLAYRDGATRLSVQLYAPAAAVGTGEGVRLAIVARAADGSEAARVDEDAKLRKTRSDFFADRALRVLPGEYDVAAVLLDASGKVLVSGRRPVTVPALPTEFSASALVVAVNDFPTDTPAADDPFTFSARRFVVKGDGKLDPADGLSYAVRVYNPPVDAGVAHAHAQAHDQAQAEGPAADRRADPAGGAAEGSPVSGGRRARARPRRRRHRVEPRPVPQGERLRAARHDPRHGHAEEARPRRAVHGRGLGGARLRRPRPLPLRRRRAEAYSTLTLEEPTPTRFVATSRTVATNRMLPVPDLNSPR